MSYTYEYPRAALTVDCVVFGLDNRELKVLLIERGLEPFKGKWALPGGFVHVDETLDEAARRELSEETGVKETFLEQLHTYGTVDRDPRERVVSVAYYALVKMAEHKAKADSDAAAAQWFPIAQCPPLAFDHAEILVAALDRLKSRAHNQPIGFESLPPELNLNENLNLPQSTLKSHDLKPATPPRSGPKTMLIVDDDPDFADTIRMQMEADGYRVDTATDGVEAIKKVMLVDYSVILCDMIMPNMGGDMFYLAVEGLKPQLGKRFIFMTGYLKDPRVDTFIKRARALMIWKPFPLHVLLEAIKVIERKA